GEQWGAAKHGVLKGAARSRPAPPPALSSAEGARDYNEVKSLGGTNSTARTPEQSEAVKFWDNVNFGPAWQAAARELSIKKELPLAECARLFALLNMSLANAYIVNWDAKYFYKFWRPVTAIRNGAQDGTDATERDAPWTSLNPTPLPPEYPSQATINATSNGTRATKPYLHNETSPDALPETLWPPPRTDTNRPSFRAK